MTEPLIVAAQLTISDDDSIDYASAIIRAACGWHIYPSQQDDLVLDSRGGDLLVLPSKYVTSVDEVTVVDSSGESVDLVEGVDYRWSELGSLTRLNGCWPDGDRTVEVKFTHGYSQAPRDLQALSVSVSKRWPASTQPWSSMSMGRASVSSAGLGAGGKGVTPGSFTSAEQLVINRYRLTSSG